MLFAVFAAFALFPLGEVPEAALVYARYARSGLRPYVKDFTLIYSLLVFWAFLRFQESLVVVPRRVPLDLGAP